MHVKIGRRRYQITTAFIVLLRYRIYFRESFLKTFLSPKYIENQYLCMIRLVWCAIEGKRPDFQKFLQTASKCKGFGAVANLVQAGVLASGGERKSESSDSSGEEIDELDILAVMMSAGMDMGMVNILPAFLIVETITRKADLMGKPSKEPQKKYKKMNSREVFDLYGISR